MNFKELGNNIELGFGWLRRWRRPAQSPMAKEFKNFVNKIELWNNLQMNLMNFGIKCNWGLDGCARWRRPAQGHWQRNLRSWGLKLNWGFIFK